MSYTFLSQLIAALANIAASYVGAPPACLCLTLCCLQPTLCCPHCLGLVTGSPGNNGVVGLWRPWVTAFHIAREAKRRSDPLEMLWLGFQEVGSIGFLATPYCMFIWCFFVTGEGNYESVCASNQGARLPCTRGKDNLQLSYLLPSQRTLLTELLHFSLVERGEE